VSDFLTNEDNAIDTIVQIEQKFGWVTVVVDRDSVEYATNLKLTDDQWNRLRVSRAWTSHLHDALTEGLGDLISEVAYRALPDLGEG
jgi:hypothetical protein